MSHLEVSAHLTVRPGCLEGFKRQAAEIDEGTRCRIHVVHVRPGPGAIADEPLAQS